MTEGQKFVASALAVVATILAALALTFWLFTLAAKGSDGPFFVETAGGAFNKHIQALTDEDWELAQSYLHADCQITVQDVEDTFSEGGIENPERWADFRVFSHGDDEAFLWFEETGGIQYMTKQDGQWVINCGDPR
jgi:hypothetical protein